MQNLLQQNIQNGLPGNAHVAPNFGAPNFAAHGQAPGFQIPPPPPPPGAQFPQFQGVPAGHLGFPPPFVLMQPQPVLPAVALGAGYMAPQQRTDLLAQLLGSTHGNSADAATRRAYAGVPTLSAPTLTPARVVATPGTVHFTARREAMGGGPPALQAAVGAATGAGRAGFAAVSDGSPTRFSHYLNTSPVAGFDQNLVKKASDIMSNHLAPSTQSSYSAG
eukprot:8446_1